MDEVFLKLNSILTHVIVFGNLLVDSNDNEIIVIITGNPGLPDFYREFSKKIYSECNLPIVVIGHAGHEVVPDENSNILRGQEDLFNLKGQINHKIELIKGKLGSNCKLHLIGHSIGAWIILEILHNNQDIADRTISLSLLFPTTQHIAQSRNGLFMDKVLRHINFVPMTLVNLFHHLPNFLKTLLIKIYLWVHSLPNTYIDRIFKYLHPAVIEKVLFLAYDEMDNVNELNHSILTRIKDRICIIYSPQDEWAPLKFIKDFERYCPPLIMIEAECAHAFVLKSSDYIGGLVSQFIREYI